MPEMKNEQRCYGLYSPWKFGIKNVIWQMPKLIRITTAPLSLKSLLSNQMRYMQENGFDVIMVSSEGKEWPDLIQNEKCDRLITYGRKDIQ